nr:uncharacterized protein C12orf56-like [Procambarus clarkii]
MNSGEETRNNKLEYFLKKNLHPSVYNNIRLYEAVIVRCGNSLSYKQAVVTGEDVYLTETPPRALTHLLNVSHITNVMLVHDLPEFLQGGVRDHTTHITVRYRQPRRNSLARLGTPSLPHHTTYPLPSTSSINEDDEDEKSERGYPEATRALAEAAHETVSACSDPLPLPRISIDTLCITSADAATLNSTKRKGWSQRVNGHQNPANGTLLPDIGSPHITLASINKPLASFNGAKLSVRSQSPDHDNACDDHSHSPMIDLLTQVSGRQVTRSVTPDTLPRAKMHRSLSALDTYHRLSPLGLDIPTRSKSVLDKPSTGHPPRRSQSLNFSDVTDGKDVKEVHLYTLSTSTLLFHLLHSLWVSSSLIQTQTPRRLWAEFQEISNERTLEHAFGQLRSELLAASTLEDQFSVLQELQQGASKYTTIRRFVWRDTTTVNIISSFIKKYMKLSRSTHRSENTEEELQIRQDELEMLTLTLDTLATCLKGTQRCPFKMKTLKHNKYECLRNLVNEAMKTPEIPAVYRLTCVRWLTDFRELSSRAWENLPEKELLRLVQEVTHTSTSALYELLGSVTEFSWVCGLQPQTDEVIPSLTTLLQHVPVEGWLSYSVPQLLVLLHPEHGGETSECDSALIHQYCSVLATFLHHSPRALQYCITNYAEELRYYVHESMINCLFGEACPVRPHTLKLVRMISQLVTSKRYLRAR